MNLRTFVESHAPALQLAGLPRARQTLRQLVADRLGLDDAALFANPDRLLSAKESAALERDAAMLARGYPLAYLLKKVPFLDWTFRVDERALIPRPETEELVRRVAAGYAVGEGPANIIDLCCGSGVMGLALALSFPGTRVTLTDLSPAALDLCRENAGLHGLGDRVRIQAGDLWSAVAVAATFDLVVANPPYVAAQDPVAVSVSTHEPGLALHGGPDGGDHLRSILAALPRRLNPGGRAAFETGHDHQTVLGPWLKERFSAGYRWEQDLFGVTRYLFFDQVEFSEKGHLRHG